MESEITNDDEIDNTLEHEDLKILLNWKNRSIEDWTADDVKLGHLIRKRHYKPKENLTEDEKELIGRLVLERSKTEDKIYKLATLRMWIPKREEDKID